MLDGTSPEFRLHNTFSRRQEIFEPADKSSVGMYVCGPTVYDFAHVGNARPAVVFDIVFRLFRRLYGMDAVKYVRNITDVDDKIMARAAETGEPINELTRRTEAIYQADMGALGCLTPSAQPRATEHIPHMIKMIEKMIDNGGAYEADGHVLFHVPGMDDYGRLSGKKQDELIAGARIDVADYKRDPSDFVLWKPASQEEVGWPSPWGKGRPGWHIECSAMSAEHLGATFDLHGGGVDLVFPHHENEIAQSRCAHGESHMARYWMHNGYVTVDGDKMSKSLGNFTTVHQLLEEGWPGEAIRLVLLSTNYRGALDFTRDRLRDAIYQLDRFYGALADAGIDDALQEGGDLPLSEEGFAFLLDDLNTAGTLAWMHLQVTAIHKTKPKEKQERLRAAQELRAVAGVMGLLEAAPTAWLQRGKAEDVAMIEERIAARLAAKQSKDFAEADRIRDELLSEGVQLLDRPGGVTDWRRASPAPGGKEA